MTLFTLHILAALILGVLIGAERQIGNHPAGLRTNTLVCLGAALFASMSLLVDHDSSPTRIAGQIVCGIGFLGGGVILREGLSVRGVNTAATLWCSAAIGTLAGIGLVVEAAIGTAFILVANMGLRPLARYLERFKQKEEGPGH